MKIYIGADHNGFHLRNALVSYLVKSGYDVEDDGDKQLDPHDDFPIFATKVVTNILSSSDKEPRGILICGSGQGMCMAANRFNGIRACMGYDLASVRSARSDDDSNVLCLAADVLKKDAAYSIVEAWLSTPFDGSARFRRRIQQLDEMKR